jgi:hypothetical protein
LSVVQETIILHSVTPLLFVIIYFPVLNSTLWQAVQHLLHFAYFPSSVVPQLLVVLLRQSCQSFAQDLHQLHRQSHRFDRTFHSLDNSLSEENNNIENENILLAESGVRKCFILRFHHANMQ